MGQCLFVTTKDTKESHRSHAEALRLYVYFVVHSTSSHMSSGGQPNKPMTRPRELIWNKHSAYKKEDCESSPLEIIKITRSEDQATTEVRRRKRRTTIANEPIPNKTAEAGSGTAATELMNAKLTLLKARKAGALSCTSAEKSPTVW